MILTWETCNEYLEVLKSIFRECFKNASVEYFTVHFTDLITYYSKKIPLSYETLFFHL